MQQLVHDIAGQFLVEMKGHLRVTGGHGTHQRHGQEGGDALRQRHGNRTAEGVGAAADRSPGIAQMLEHALGVFVKHLAGLAGDYAVVAAMEQLHPQVVLQRRHLLAQC